MSRNLIFILILLLQISASNAQDAALDWAIGLEGAGNEYGESIATDDAGNVIVAGYFQNTVDFDPSVAVANVTSVGGTDIYLAKYDSSGNYMWAIGVGSSGDDRGLSVSVDSSSNIYITGRFAGLADFDPSADTANLNPTGFWDIFLAKYDANGNYKWAFNVGSNSADEGTELAIDAEANVYVTGWFTDSADFDPSGSAAYIYSAGSADIFLAKYDSAGNYVWAYNMGGSSNDYGYSVTINNLNSIYLTGLFWGTADLDPSGSTANLNAVGQYDIFIASYDANGNYQWAKGIGDVNSDYPQSIVSDADGNAYITGYFSGTVDFDPGPSIANLTTIGFFDVFVAKYDPLGNYRWAFNVGSIFDDRAYGIDIDQAGDLYVTGFFQDIADFDPSGGLDELESAGATDVFIAKYDTAGGYIWSAGVGGTATDQGQAVTIDGNGKVLITGIYQVTADFDPGPDTVNLSTAGGFDPFVLKLGECGNTFSNPLITACDSFTVPSGDETHLTGGNYNDTIPNSLGCDSIITFNLTIISTVINNSNPILCAGDSIIVGGSTYDSTGIYQDVFVAANGCDSIVNTNLVVLTPIGSSQNIAICAGDSLLVGSSVYDSSGTYYDTLVAVSSCDSVVQTILTVNPVSSSMSFENICLGDSFLWGVYLDTTGFYSDTLVNSFGCDSIATLYLYVAEITLNVSADSVCLGDAVTFTALPDDFSNYNFYINGTLMQSDTSNVFNSNSLLDGDSISVLTSITGCSAILDSHYPFTVITVPISITSSDTDSTICAGDLVTFTATPASYSNYEFFINGFSAQSGVANSFVTVSMNNGDIIYVVVPADSVCFSTSDSITMTVNPLPSGSNTSYIICSGSYTVPSGDETYTVSGTYTDTLPGVFGCDSFLTINLTFNNNSSITINPVTCDPSYQVPSGDETYTVSGLYMDTLPNVSGCDSLITINLTIGYIDNSVTLSGDTLFSNQAGANYQWLDCGNGKALISGATGQSYAPTSSGSYAVALDQSMCIDTSSCYTVNLVGIIENSFEIMPRIYPNPTSGSLTIVLDKEYSALVLELSNMLGQVTQVEAFSNTNSISIDIKGAKGLYLAHLSSNSGQHATIRVLKE